jgi:hypothetical protein
MNQIFEIVRLDPARTKNNSLHANQIFEIMCLVLVGINYKFYILFLELRAIN